MRMGIAHQLAAVKEGFRIVASFPEWRETGVLLGESDPEGCAACSARTNPQNSYREGPLFACYTAEALYRILALASREHINFVGAVTWSFEFEGQPYFAGYRELATNGVDKPVLNAFRMFGLLGETRTSSTSSGALSDDEILREGVRDQADTNAIAARGKREIEVLIWNYHDDDLPAPATAIRLAISGLPTGVQRGLLEHFRIDGNHSNAFAAWKEMGSPQLPSPDQYSRLEQAGQLQMLNSPEWLPIKEGTAVHEFLLPRHGLSLVRLSW